MKCSYCEIKLGDYAIEGIIDNSRKVYFCRDKLEGDSLESACEFLFIFEHMGNDNSYDSHAIDLKELSSRKQKRRGYHESAPLRGSYPTHPEESHNGNHGSKKSGAL